MTTLWAETGPTREAVEGGGQGRLWRGTSWGPPKSSVPAFALTHAQNPNSCTVSAAPWGHLRALPLGLGSPFADPEA